MDEILHHLRNPGRIRFPCKYQQTLVSHGFNYGAEFCPSTVGVDSQNKSSGRALRARAAPELYGPVPEVKTTSTSCLPQNRRGCERGCVYQLLKTRHGVCLKMGRLIFFPLPFPFQPRNEYWTLKKKQWQMILINRETWVWRPLEGLSPEQ